MGETSSLLLPEKYLEQTERAQHPAAEVEPPRLVAGRTGENLFQLPTDRLRQVVCPHDQQHTHDETDDACNFSHKDSCLPPTKSWRPTTQGVNPARRPGFRALKLSIPGRNASWSWLRDRVVGRAQPNDSVSILLCKSHEPAIPEPQPRITSPQPLNALNSACISSATFAGSLNVWAISSRSTSR